MRPSITAVFAWSTRPVHSVLVAQVVAEIPLFERQRMLQRFRSCASRLDGRFRLGSLGLILLAAVLGLGQLHLCRFYGECGFLLLQLHQVVVELNEGCVLTHNLILSDQHPYNSTWPSWLQLHRAVSAIDVAVADEAGGRRGWRRQSGIQRHLWPELGEAKGGQRCEPNDENRHSDCFHHVCTNSSEFGVRNSEVGVWMARSGVHHE
jgi:hypothetical protein